MKSAEDTENKPRGVSVYEAGESARDIKPRLQYTEHKKMTPREFGCTVKESLEKQAHPLLGPLIIGGTTLASVPAYFALDRWLQPTSNYRAGAGTGALVGGLAGAAKGFLSPGEEAEYDEQGNVIGKKRRSRLAGLARQGLMGAGLGTAAGVAAEHLAPESMSRVMNNATTTATNFGKRVGAGLGLRKPEWRRNWLGFLADTANTANPMSWVGMGIPQSIRRNTWTGSYL